LISDIANNLTTSVCVDGQTPMAHNLSMGNFKLINVQNGVNPQDAATINQLSASALASNNFTTYSATATLPNSIVGGTVQVAGTAAAITLTLPNAALNAVPYGRIEFINSSAFNVTLITQSGNTLAHVNAATTSSITLAPGDFVTLIAKNTSAWVATNGSAELGFATAFASSQVVNGYAFLPNGLMMQWGTWTGTTAAVLTGGIAEAVTTVTYPVAFPNALFSIVAMALDIAGASSQEIASAGSPNTTGFFGILSCKATSVVMSGKYIAIGN
jgi:hypothetical protein